MKAASVISEMFAVSSIVTRRSEFRLHAGSGGAQGSAIIYTGKIARNIIIIIMALNYLKWLKRVANLSN